ncbi:MAG: (Myosin heavy-chain) kinase [Chthonomonadaceae bacterium]|nr:(Myosin heavy-chain) kinase [Chthonomonadaceae bacterium]
MASRRTCLTALRALVLGSFVALALLCLWPHASMAQGALPTKWLYSPIGQVYSVVYSPDGTLLAVGGANNADAVVQIQTLATGAVLCLSTAASEVVTSVAFSPDGKTLAVGGRKHTYSTDLSTASYSAVLELWNVSTGKRIATLDTSVDYSDSTFALAGVNSVAFSSDGTMLAAGGDSRTGSKGGGVVELWSVSGRTRIRAFPTTANAGIASVAFSPDGHTLADGGERQAASTGIGVLEVWNVSDGTLFESLNTAAADGVLSVAFSPDGKTLADGGRSFNSPSGGYSDILELWNVSTGTRTQSLGSAARSLTTSVAFSPDGKTLADVGESTGVDTAHGVLELWSVSGGNRIAMFDAGSFVNTVAFSPDGTTLAYAGQANFGNAGLVNLWSVTTQTVIKAISTAEIGLVQSVALSPDGKMVAAAGEGYDTSGQGFSLLEIRSASTGTLLVSLPTAANDFAPSIAFSPDGKTLAIGGENSTDTPTGTHYSGVLELWNVSTGKLIASLPTAANIIVNSVAFSPDGKTLAIGGANFSPTAINFGVLELWNVSTAKLITSQVQTAIGSVYTSVAFSPDGKTLAAGGRFNGGSLLELWNVASGKRVANLNTAADNGVNSVVFSLDGRTLAVGGAKVPSNAAVLELLNVSDGTLRATLTSVLSTHPIRALAFSASGRVLFVGTDANLEVFSAATGTLLSYYFQYPYSNGPGSIAVSPGGLLAYGTGFGALAVAPAPYSNSFLDFNGDGFTDLLVQNSTTGAIAAWYMNGSAQVGSALFSHNPSVNYALVGVGDFAGDGTTALVLQNRSDDTIAFWYTGGVNNTVITGGDYVRPNPFPGWKVVGVGDFNGDGESDLVFQNRTTHQVVIWFMDGPVYQGGASLPYYPPAGWQVVGTGDFNGDGKSDLVFQNQTTGRIVVWYMDGITYIGGSVLSAVPGPGWKVVGVGDYNQDGSPDLLFQNRTTNQAAVWYLQGSTLQGSANLSPFPPTGWSIVGPR